MGAEEVRLEGARRGRIEKRPEVCKGRQSEEVKRRLGWGLAAEPCLAPRGPGLQPQQHKKPSKQKADV